MKISKREVKHIAIGFGYETIETTFAIVLPEDHPLYQRFASIEVSQIMWPNRIMPDIGECQMITHMKGTHTIWFNQFNKDKQKKQIFREVEEFIIASQSQDPLISNYKPQLQH
jgi:hypothetical protein